MDPVGELANIDQYNRLNVPAAVLRSVTWWKKSPLEVTAELVEFGLIRIYLPADISAAIDALRKGSLGFEDAAVLVDRYRLLHLGQGGRLGLIKEVTAALGFAFGEKPTLYTQAFPTSSVRRGFEVMSLEYRHVRLQRAIRHIEDYDGNE